MWTMRVNLYHPFVIAEDAATRRHIHAGQASITPAHGRDAIHNP